MLSPPKKSRAGSALGRFIASLRPDRRSGSPGSLPVQTGFPTSLADLYVKNQSRLKKPSKKSKKRRHGSKPESVVTVDSSPHASDSATSPVVSSSVNVEEVVAVAEEERVLPLVSDDVSVCEKRNSLGTVAVVFVNILVLVVLAIFGKKLVLGFTAFAFFSWFLDSVRLDLVRFFKPCAEARSNLGLERRSFEIVSPIREVKIQTESDSTGVEIETETNQSRDLDEISEVSFEFSEVQIRNSTKKSIMKRLFPKKHCKRKQQEKHLLLDDISIRSKRSINSIGSKETDVTSISEKEEVEIVNLVTEESHEEEQSTREIPIPPTQIMEGEISQTREIGERISWFVVFLMVILFGLVEGKAVALILTIFCSTTVSLIELARRNQRSDRRFICN